MDSFTSDAASFAVTLQHLDGHAELILVGELDVATAPDLLTTLNSLIEDDHRDLRLNLSGLSFMDASGVSVLMQVHKHLGEVGGRLTLTFVHGIPQRILGICGLLEVITEHHSPSASSPRRQEASIEPRRTHRT
jgi:anti-sigma B factor antagonist